jgi:hypothetical protein
MLISALITTHVQQNTTKYSDLPTQTENLLHLIKLTNRVYEFPSYITALDPNLFCLAMYW